MCAAQYVNTPGYAAIVFRKTLTELMNPDGLIPRSIEWWSGRAHWNGNEHEWTFPSGAKVKFGFIGADVAMGVTKFRYQGMRVQTVCWDELTAQTPDDYSYLFSRLDRPNCEQHRPGGIGEFNRECQACREAEQLATVPLRVRAATNPGGVGACIPHGDVLTPTGWIRIQDLRVGDRVYTVNPNGDLIETTVAQTHASHYTGKLVKVRARGLKIDCTPDHAIAKRLGKRFGKNTREKTSDRFSLVTFGELPGQATILRSVSWSSQSELATFAPPEVKTRARRLVQPAELSGDLYLSLLGWHLSEGCCVDRDKAFAISQKKPRTRAKLKAFLQSCGFKFTWTKEGAIVYAPDWWGHFKQFGLCDQKFVPTHIKTLSARQLAILFDSLMDGDGHTTNLNKSGHYYTTSPRLADDVCEIAVKLGYVVNVTSRQRILWDKRSYDVAFKTVNSGGTELLTGQHVYKVLSKTKRRSDVQMVDYDGPVYCIGIDNTHSFVVRQNGSIWVSGNSWVKNHFQIRRNDDGTWSGHNPEAAFVPAYVQDNPSVDQEAYIANLNRMTDKVTRDQLLKGDWGISEEGRFKQSWLRYYTIDSRFPDKRDWRFTLGSKTYSGRQLKIFMTVDPAGSEREGPGDTTRYRKEPSATAISTWGVTPDADLLWLDCRAMFCEIPDIPPELKKTYLAWHPDYVGIEKNGAGIGVYQSAIRLGLPVRELSPRSGDKLVRSTDAQIRAENGKLWLPQSAPWLDDCLDELLTWTGHKQQRCDRVDTLSYAAMLVSQEAAIPNTFFGADWLPEAIRI